MTLYHTPNARTQGQTPVAHNIAQITGWPPGKTKIERKENDGTLAALQDHRTRTLAGIKGLRAKVVRTTAARALLVSLTPNCPSSGWREITGQRRVSEGIQQPIRKLCSFLVRAEFAGG